MGNRRIVYCYHSRKLEAASAYSIYIGPYRTKRTTPVQYCRRSREFANLSGNGSHGLRSSISRVNGHWACQWERANFDPPPCRINTPQPITKHFSQMMKSATHIPVASLMQIRPRGASAQMGEI